MQTDVTGFFTAGPMGFQSRSARVSIFAPDGKWRGEGGDLYSDLRGLARGARVSWSPGQKWTPSVSLYVHGSNPASNGATVVALPRPVSVAATCAGGRRGDLGRCRVPPNAVRPAEAGPDGVLPLHARSDRRPRQGGLRRPCSRARRRRLGGDTTVGCRERFQPVAARLDSVAPGAAGQRHAGAVVVDRVGRRRRDQRGDAAGSSRSGPADAACSMGTHRLSAPRGAVRFRPPAEPQQRVLHAGSVGKRELPAIHPVVRRWDGAGVGRGQLDAAAWPPNHRAIRDGVSRHL